MDRIQRAIDAVAEGPLAAHLRTQRWFGGKGREVRAVRVRDHAIVDPGAAGRPSYVFALFDVEHDDGASDLYSVPLVVGTGGAGTADSIVAEVQVEGAAVTIADACADDRFARAMLATLARAGTIPSVRGGAVRGNAGGVIAGLLGGDAIEALPVKRLRTEQSNTSIIFSPGGHDRIVLKCLRKLPEGLGVEVEIGALLTRVGFKGAPTLLGDLSYVPPPRKGEPGACVEPITLAVAQTFVPNVGDGWGHALADLRARFDVRRSTRPSREPYDVAMRTLGRTTAEMHLALASERRHPAFSPEPIDDDDRERLATGAAARLVEVVEWMASMDEWPADLRGVAREVVRHAPALADRLRAARHLPEGLHKIRIHGDLHLGQVLRVHEDDGRATWTIVDFEGEPMRALSDRRSKVSPLRDVAGMLRSFDYAAFAALRDAKAESNANAAAPTTDLQSIAAAWRDDARRAFLDGWVAFAAPSEVPIVPKVAHERDEAIALFELDKALYELAYEIENRPDWIAIPLRGIHALVTAK
jgi:maltose alpha-D-glucosyltransferase/alpha-amylase